MAKAKKPKSMTILGVRGLKVHERTPEGCDIELRHWALKQAGLGDGFASTRRDDVRDAAVQIQLWRVFRFQEDVSPYVQCEKWTTVFNRAMKRYEKEQKR